MAREHARVKLSIWDDEDFRKLSPAAQHLYFVLLTSAKLDYCGVTDWRPARIAQFAGGWTARAVEIAAQELSEQRYIVIDTSAEEVLLRSFIRNDELLEQPNLAVAMKKAHVSLASNILRGVVVHELRRLRRDKPDLKGWSRIPGLLDKASLDPSKWPTFQASSQPSVDPSGKANLNPSDNPSGCVSPTTATTTSTTTAPATPSGKTPSDDLEGNRYVTLPAISVTEPKCALHPRGDGGTACGGCARVREWRDRNEQRARDEAARAATRRLIDEQQSAKRNATPMPEDVRSQIAAVRRRAVPLLEEATE